MVYTVKQLALIAGVSVRTLHYYDQIGLLKPTFHAVNGYRQYDEKAIVPLQQILFFRELGFSLDDIKDIMSRPDFDVSESLRSHRTLLEKRADRINELLATIDRTIRQLKGDTEMDIKDYYVGFSDEQIEEYRKEVRERWGEDTLKDSETRVMNMGKQQFATLQNDGGGIFQAIAEAMPKGAASPEVQRQVAKWRQWLENFSRHSDEAVLGLGRTYSQDPRFAAFFDKYGKDFPAFFTRAIEHYCDQGSTQG